MRHETQIWAPAVGTLTVLGVVLAGCTEPPPTSGEKTLSLAMPSDFTGWDPTKMIGADTNIWYEQAVYDRLINCDAKGEMSANVAESWTINDNNTEYTFKIRGGQRFSDETTLDATDVKASLDYNAAHGSGPSAFPGIQTTIVNDREVVVRFPQPNPTATHWWCSALGSIVPSEKAASGDFSSPIGSGPYVYDSGASTPGSEYKFSKDPDNWNAESYPYEKLQIKVIADPTATLNALRTGQIGGAITPADTAIQAKASGLEQVKLQGAWAGLIIGDRNGQLVPALGNVDVRRAINMVFDKEAIAKSLYQGEVDPTPQIFAVGSPAYIENFEDPYPFDVDAAKKLMADAGYADGFDVDIPFVDGFGWGAELPVIIQQLSLLNIRAESVTLSGPNAITELISGRFPIIFWPLGNNGNSIIDINTDIAEDGIWNTQKSTDPEVTRLVTEIRNASTADSPALQKKLNSYIIDQAWFAPWVYPARLFSYVKGSMEIPAVTNNLAPSLRDFK